MHAGCEWLVDIQAANFVASRQLEVQFTDRDEIQLVGTCAVNL